MDDLAAVNGSAFGYRTDLGLFGGPPTTKGPAPTVTLPPDGGAVGDSLPMAIAQYGPAVILESGLLTVSTEGAPCPGGSATSAASVEDVGPGPFTAEEVSSTCTSTETGTTGSATVVNGRLVLSADPETGEPGETVEVPVDPEPGTEYEGELAGVGDRFRIVFNEQVLGDGSITVNAVHMYFLGPVAVGDMVIAQSHSALTASDDAAQ